MRDKLLLKDGKVQPKLSQKFQPYLNLDDAEVIKSNRCAFDRYVLHAHTLSDDIRLKKKLLKNEKSFMGHFLLPSALSGGS